MSLLGAAVVVASVINPVTDEDEEEDEEDVHAMLSSPAEFRLPVEGTLLILGSLPSGSDRDGNSCIPAGGEEEGEMEDGEEE